MDNETAKDLEAQKAEDPGPSAIFADESDKSRQLSSHAASISPPSTVELDQGDTDIDVEWMRAHQKLQAPIATMGRDGVRAFAFFKMMNEINIQNLEKELKTIQRNAIEAERSGQGKGVCLSRLEDQLHRYTTAIRDYDYMNNLDNINLPLQYFERVDNKLRLVSVNKATFMVSKKALQIKTLPRRANASSDPLRRWLGRILPHALRWTDEEASARPAERYNRDCTPEITAPFVDKLARFIVAMTGGLSVVIPMLIMSIPQGSTRSLVTTSVAVVFFAGIISVGFSASNAETLGITAAYAAVLVVFVGTSVQQASPRG